MNHLNCNLMRWLILSLAVSATWTGGANSGWSQAAQTDDTADTTETAIPAKSVEIPYPVELKPYSLTVIDEQGKPVAGVRVEAAGVRCEEDQGSWYGWPTPNAGNKNQLHSDDQGRITVMYPVRFGRPSEWVTTNKIDFRFTHPEFVASTLEVDPREDEVRHSLIAGCPVLFSAIDDSEQPLNKFGVLMAGRGTMAEWVLENGEMRSRGIPDGAWQTMLVAPGKDESGPLFSGVLPARFAKGRPVTIRNIKLSPGLRLNGTIAAAVPRPVMQGTVVAHCLPKPQGLVHEDQNPSLAWCATTDIAPDGSFTFASLPNSGTVQLIAICRDWVIVSEPRDGRGGFVQGIQINLDNAEIVDKQLTVDVPMQAAGSVEVSVTKPNGEPLVGAQVSTWPNQMFDKSGSTILGMGFPSIERIHSQIDRQPNQFTQAYVRDRMKNSPYLATTNQQGKAVLHTIPIGKQEQLVMEHPDYRIKTKEKQQHAFTAVSYQLVDNQPLTIAIETELITPN